MTSDDKTYTPFELFKAHAGPLPPSFAERRRVAAAIKELSESLIRIEANSEQLADWGERIEAIAADTKAQPRLDTKLANKAMLSGKATANDVFQVMDYNPVGGAANPISPELEWITFDAKGVEAQTHLGMAYQGPPGRVHGGVLSWILDSVLASAIHAAFRIAMTGELKVRYLASTPLYELLTIRGRISQQEGRKLFLEGGVWVGDKQTVEASGVWLIPKSIAGL